MSLKNEIFDSRGDQKVKIFAVILHEKRQWHTFSCFIDCFYNLCHIKKMENKKVMQKQQEYGNCAVNNDARAVPSGKNKKGNDWWIVWRMRSEW